MRCAVLTVSDRCSRGAARDTAGPATVALLREQWPEAEIEAALVPDEVPAITAFLTGWMEEKISLILTVGGTGLGPRDRTPEATRALLEREAPGIAEAMRARGAEQNPMAWLSRGVAGLAQSSLIINLPGSRRGATESLAAILPLVRHGLETMTGDQAHG